MFTETPGTPPSREPLEPEEGAETDATEGGIAAATLSRSATSLASLRGVVSVRTDHLGVPLRSLLRQRYRFARTYTVIYDSGKVEDKDAEKQWRLLQDSRRLMDSSVDGLRRLLGLFKSSAKAPEHSEIGPHHFRMAMRQHGARDPVLLRRLFAEFSTMPDRIDFRHFLFVLASVNEESAEHRLGLMFEVWDADDSGTLSAGEIGPHVTSDQPTHKKEAALEGFNRAWRQIVRFCEKEDNGEMFAGLGGPNEVTKDNLIGACAAIPQVRAYFDDMITRKPPKAAERQHGTLQARMRELDAEVVEELKRASDESDGHEATRHTSRPLTVPQGHLRPSASHPTGLNAARGPSQHYQPRKPSRSLQPIARPGSRGALIRQPHTTDNLHSFVAA